MIAESIVGFTVVVVVVVAKNHFFPSYEGWKKDLEYLLDDPLEGSWEWQRIRVDEIRRLRKVGERLGYKLPRDED